MCGIAGYFLNESSKTPLSRIQDTIEILRHRGPDDEAFLLSNLEKNFEVNQYSIGEPLCLIHTRLSINDLSKNGRNPLTYSDSNVYVVFNGEIYNFRQLRQTLIESGFSFSTETDTEVLLVMYLLHGDRFVELLDGMFAIAIWDLNNKKLKLFRDRFGVKPLYFIQNSNGVFFGSEVRAVLKLSNTVAKLDPIGLAQHLQFQNQIDSRTLFADVSILLPGSKLVCEADGKIEFVRWWKARINPNDSLTKSEIRSNVTALLREAVENQLIGDVKISSYLSGGLDSATVAAIASEKIPNLNTITVGFETANFSNNESNFDETHQASLMAAHLGLSNHSRRIGAVDFLENWVETVIAIEDLRVGPSVQIMTAANLAKQYSTVVLSGAGGDELFAGYPWRYPDSEDDSEIGFEKWYQQASRLLTIDDISNVLIDNSVLRKNEWNPRDYLYNMWISHECLEPIDNALLMDIEIFLHGLLLVEDKISMNSALEVRVPLLSNKLSDYALQIPHKYKTNLGLGKVILREIAKSILPPSFSEKVKQGFTPPLEGWIRGELSTKIDNFTFKNPKYLPVVLKVGNLRRDFFLPHLEEEANNRMLIWTLTSLEIWGRHFILGEPKSRIKEDLIA